MSSSAPSRSGSFVTTSCPSCGPTDIGIDRVVLHVDEDRDRTVASIHCPSCGARFAKRVDDAMSLLMATVGVEVRCTGRPAEVDERPSDLAPLTAAEIDDFAGALAATDDLLAALTES